MPLRTPRNRTTTVAVALACIALPFALGLGLGYYSAPILSPQLDLPIVVRRGQKVVSLNDGFIGSCKCGPRAV